MDPHQIVLFLQLVREAAARDRLVPRDRLKNQQTLAMLGISRRQMLTCIEALRPDQALGIPWDNRNPEHPDELVCDFGMSWEGHPLYVKIAIVGLEDGAAGAIISFHLAEKPLEFPYLG